MGIVSGAKAALTRARTISWARHPCRTGTGLRVLLFHHVREDVGPLAVHPSEFRRQMEHLAEQGYRGIDVVTALDSLYGGGFDPSLIAITFDDGFEDVKDHALDVLAELGFSATVFVTTGVADRSLHFSWAPKEATLTWEDICRLDREGVLRFEPHSITHLDLTRLEEADCAREIVGSKLLLERRLGREAKAFCYPCGFVGERERDLVRDAGFRYGIACEPGLNLPTTDVFLIHRIQIDHTDRIRDFDAKIHGSHDRPLLGRRSYRRVRYGPGAAMVDNGAASVSAAEMHDSFEATMSEGSSDENPIAGPCDLLASIVNHNAAARTLACVASLEADQTRRCSLEIVVLDNDSDEPIAPALRAQFPDVKVISQPFRNGFGANHNRVILATKSRYVLVLNNDTTIPPGAIDAFVDYLDANPKVGIIGPLLTTSDGALQPAAFGYPTPLASFVFAATLGQVGMAKSKFKKPKKVDWVSGAAMVIRRSALDEVGLFDEGFFMFHEDTDLCRRLRTAGYEARCLPSVSVVHDHWGATRDRYKERIDEAHRSRRRYWAKHHGRVGARLAPYADAARYAAAARIASLAARLPERLRPQIARDWDPVVFSYNAKSALRHTHGSGLRELADAHNAAHAAKTSASEQQRR
jgi:GT2 family glycosyltransferase/peptidoglycan/xylan/chitin deacetylase (PgdA/CDA1 family)